jgi:hypothetical protein
MRKTIHWQKTTIHFFEDRFCKRRKRTSASPLPSSFPYFSFKASAGVFNAREQNLTGVGSAGKQF